MENSFRALIDQANSILIVIPSKPYFDQVAGALSLYLTLRNLKEVSIISSNPMTVEFNRLIGVNKVLQDLGNKNLLIKFAGYEASNIERVSYDIENRQFQLTVIPKAGVKAPEKSQIELSYTGFSSNLIILVGGANESHFPILSSKDTEKAKVMHLGTRDITNGDSTHRIISFDRPASCDSELIASMLIEGQFKLDADIATNLLMGVEEGSNNYTGPEVSAATFEIVSELMRLGGKRLAQNQPTIKYSDFPPGAIPGQMPQMPFVGQQMPQMPMPRPQSVTQISDDGMEGPMPTVPVANPNEPEQIPDEWLQTPKVYKGTSTS